MTTFEQIPRNLEELPDWLRTPELLARICEKDIHVSFALLASLHLDNIVEGCFGGRERTRSVLLECHSQQDWDMAHGKLLEAIRPHSWEWLGKPFPAPPFGSSKLVPIDSNRKLKREGKTMNNCCAQLATEVRKGKLYFFEWRGSTRATVALARRADGCWVVAEAKGKRNAELSDETHDEIEVEVKVAATNGGRAGAGW